MVQQHYKSEDYAKIVTEEPFDPTTYKIPETGDDNIDGAPEDNQNEQAPEDEAKPEDQIDSTSKPADE